LILLILRILLILLIILILLKLLIHLLGFSRGKPTVTMSCSNRSTGVAIFVQVH
jgi:hypothetical protein